MKGKKSTSNTSRSTCLVIGYCLLAQKASIYDLPEALDRLTTRTGSSDLGEKAAGFIVNGKMERFD